MRWRSPATPSAICPALTAHGAHTFKSVGSSARLVEADCTTCYTVADFAREYPRGVYVLGCSGHVLAVIDGAWWDSWDSGAECPIYYWYKED